MSAGVDGLLTMERGYGHACRSMPGWRVLSLEQVVPTGVEKEEASVCKGVTWRGGDMSPASTDCTWARGPLSRSWHSGGMGFSWRYPGFSHPAF